MEVNEDYLWHVRNCADDAQDAATTPAELHYAQGVYDAIGHILANPHGAQVDPIRMAAVASQFAKVMFPED